MLFRQRLPMVTVTSDLDSEGNIMRVHRRMSRRCAVAACLAVVAGLTAGSTSVGVGAAVTTVGEWQQPFADAARSNSNPSETELTAATIASKQMRPAYSLAGLPRFGECGGVWNLDMRRPLVAGGRIYAYNGREVEARDLATGDLLWRSADLTGAFADSFPRALTLAGNRVLVGGITACTSASSPHGFIMSLDAADGHTQWQHFPDGEIDHLTVSGSTVVVDGLLNEGSPSTFAAYDVTNGTVLWSRGSECGASQSFIVGRRVVSNTVTRLPITTGCGTVQLSTGATVWTKPPNWTFFRGDGPDVSDPSIYAKTPDGALVALRSNGTTRWNAGTGYGNVFAAGQGQVYVACLGGGSICALDRLTGAQQWTSETTNLVGVVSASDFILLPGNGTVLRATDGVQVGTLAMRIDAWQAAAVADGHVVAVDGRDLDVFELNP